ncbi:YhgE/Pip family protein [Paenibacillus nasutitermitis]|uniref:Phage infection protein n=1 Tax=Paenibacillus nasutitermitis TaxID=1652958 RepID=A0A916Z4F2_9BACL|nr:YhgE/Pip domain-containing protein [Paenibacillus nasutitermitis]GGD76286.1 phage infection protein [Paenibacillus nasutitermitis]
MGFTLFGKEISRMVRNPKLLIPIIGILFIPIMYSGMLVGAFWDPYGKLSELPVAVVNEDQGAAFEGKTLAVGSDLVANLKENKQFNWAFVDRAEAEKGLEAGDYYYAIEIPASFSKQATTLLDENPQPASLQYISNDSDNYLAAKIGHTAIDQLQAELSQEVTKSYAEAVFNQIGDAADGITKASEGAAKLKDGAADAASGASLLLENVGKLASGTLALQNGAAALDKGAAQVAKGTAVLSTGAASMSDGLGKLAAAGKQLGGGAEDALKAAKKLSAGLDAAKTGSGQLADSSAKLAAALEAYAAANEDAAQDPALQELLAAARKTAAGAGELAGSSAKLAAGATQLQQGQSSLLKGIDALHAKLADAKQSGAKLAAGAKEAAGGAAKLADGAAAAGRGAAELADGSGKLKSGSAALASGARQLAGGSAELADKLGSAAAETSGVQGTDALYDMFAKPVQVEEQKLSNVPNYGTGFTPYFLSLGLFVGALLSTMVLPMRETAEPPRSGWSWFASKALLFLSIGTVQGLIADAILVYGIGVHVNHPLAFVGLTVLTSVTFMMIIQFLVTAMDQPGRFIAVILLILQLTGSAGTYPRELVPAWLRTAGDWLPMTYSISAFRTVITGESLDKTGNLSLHIALFGIVFAAMSLVFFLLLYRKNRRTAELQGSKMLTA